MIRFINLPYLHHPRNLFPPIYLQHISSTKTLSIILLMVQKFPARKNPPGIHKTLVNNGTVDGIWDVQNPVNNGTNYQPQLVQDFFHQQDFSYQPQLVKAGFPKPSASSLAPRFGWSCRHSWCRATSGAQGPPLKDAENPPFFLPAYETHTFLHMCLIHVFFSKQQFCWCIEFGGGEMRGYVYIYIYGCKSKCEVRINPQNPQAIQTPDPDLRSRPIQTSRSRPIQTSRSRPMIQTTLFYVGWTYSFSKYWKVLLCTTKYDAGWSREFWKNLAIPFQTSFQTVPDPFQTSSMGSKGSVHSQPCCPRRKNRSVRPAQNHLIQFKSYMKWLSWFQALRSRRAEKTFYESGRSRRPDHRGTIQTRLSTHAHIYIYDMLFLKLLNYSKT